MLKWKIGQHKSVKGLKGKPHGLVIMKSLIQSEETIFLLICELVLFLLFLSRCPNFRSQWRDYWYLGAKCDQLWNTLDLILVATLPGIGLALIIGVTIQTIHYCKKKSKENINDQQ